MKKFAIVCAALGMMVGVSAVASAAQPVKSSTLAKMGLSSLSVMSDKDGESVRGKGSFALVGGVAHSSVLGQTGTTFYAAGAAHPGNTSSVAAGAGASVSGIGGQIGPFSGFVVGGTVGGSVAYAK